MLLLSLAVKDKLAEWSPNSRRQESFGLGKMTIIRGNFKQNRICHLETYDSVERENLSHRLYYN